ncbi:MAG: hypothetical protein MI923_01805 [Phycisphaerales bacterium]|nr:hypothetical protein [Phycisphaerales bacterium]
MPSHWIRKRVEAMTKQVVRQLIPILEDHRLRIQSKAHRSRTIRSVRATIAYGNRCAVRRFSPINLIAAAPHPTWNRVRRAIGSGQSLHAVLLRHDEGNVGIGYADAVRAILNLAYSIPYGDWRYGAVGRICQ